MPRPLLLRLRLPSILRIRPSCSRHPEPVLVNHTHHIHTYRHNHNFTLAPSSRLSGNMANDLSKSERESIQHLQNPAVEAEAAILTKNAEQKKDSDVAAAAAATAAATAAEAALPQKLSPADFRIYNHMAEGMEYYHNHFRQTWTTLHEACVKGRRPAHVSLKQFITMGLQLVHHLSAHHAIEEQHIFPLLAVKMPEFQSGRNAKAGGKAELLRQHEEIHRGMDGFEKYLEECRSGQRELELSTLRERMDCWGQVLWVHLDQEVRTLGADNMRKYWTKEEMGRMPM